MFYDESLLKLIAVKAVDHNMKFLIRSKNSADLTDNSMEVASEILSKIIVLQNSVVLNELTTLVEDFMQNIHSQLACAIQNEVKNAVKNIDSN